MKLTALYKNKLIAVLTTGLLIFSATLAQAKQDKPDITYNDDQPDLYIWRNSNSHSNNEATLHLVVKAGSLQEEDDELGYAHFVEHMAFNGTELFPKDQLQQQLTSLGLDVGQHSNAYTTFDHTAYTIHLNDVTPERLEAAIELLSQWAFHIQFEPTEVNKEIPVVVEEWRLQDTDKNRVDNLIADDYYKNSRYIERYPIGTRESIEQASAEKLQAFYQRWYRANNMSVIVAGDINKRTVKQLFDEYFLPDQQQSPTPQTYQLNPKAMSPELILTDDYQVDGYVELVYSLPALKTSNKDDLQALNPIFAALDIWYNNAQAQLQGTLGSVTDVDYYMDFVTDEQTNLSLYASVSRDQFDEAIALIETEKQRLLSNGFPEDDLEAWLDNEVDYLRSNQDSADFLAEEMLNHIIDGWPLLTMKERIALAKRASKTVNSDSVHAAFQQLFRSEPNVLITYPSNVMAPTTTDVANWFEQAKVANFAAVENQSGEQTWALSSTENGEIVSEDVLTSGITQWILSNGMTVNFINSKDGTDRVHYILHGLHGLNAIPEADVPAARLALPTIATSGLRNLSGPSLVQWLERNNQSINANMSFFDRAISGSGPSDDIDVMFRLLHVAMTEAKVSQNAWSNVLTQNQNYLEQIDSHPHGDWINAIEQSVYNERIELSTLSLEQLNALTPENLNAIYRNYFHGTQNFQLSIVGDVSKNDVRKEVIASIASLPKTAFEPAVIRTYPSPIESKEISISGSGEGAAIAVLRYSIPKTLLPDYTEQTGSLLTQWLDNALFSEIRENRGYVYAINAALDGGATMQDEYTLIVDFNSDPEQVDIIIAEIENKLQRLIDEPANNEQLSVWLDSSAQSFKQAITDPAVKVNVMAGASIYGNSAEDALSLDYELEADMPNKLTGMLSKFIEQDATRLQLVWLP